MAYCAFTKTIKEQEVPLATIYEELLTLIQTKLNCTIVEKGPDFMEVIITAPKESNKTMKLKGKFSLSEHEGEITVKFFGQYKMTLKGIGSILAGAITVPLAGLGLFALAGVMQVANNSAKNIHKQLRGTMLEFYPNVDEVIEDSEDTFQGDDEEVVIEKTPKIEDNIQKSS